MLLVLRPRTSDGNAYACGGALALGPRACVRACVCTLQEGLGLNSSPSRTVLLKLLTGIRAFGRDPCRFKIMSRTLGV